MRTPSLLATCSMVLALSLFPSGPARAEEERLDIDPVVRGLWTIHAVSKDRGETIQRIEPGQTLCRVSATKVRMADGSQLEVEKVVITDDDAGNPMNLVKFDTGVIWGISKKPGQPFVLVQVFDGTSFEEKMRVLVTVD